MSIGRDRDSGVGFGVGVLIERRLGASNTSFACEVLECSSAKCSIVAWGARRGQQSSGAVARPLSPPIGATDRRRLDLGHWGGWPHRIAATRVTAQALQGTRGLDDTMTRTTTSIAAVAAGSAERAAPAVSLRAIYADALREVLADPARALAEHDPRLAALLLPAGRVGPADG
jgi:hypothetical protein